MVAWSLFTMLGLLTFLSALLFLLVGWTWLRVRLHRSVIATARHELRAAFVTGETGHSSVVSFRRLPIERKIDLVIELGASFVGKERDRLNSLAAREGLSEWAEKRASSKRWWRRLQGARLFSIIDADSHTMHLLLWDNHELVRAQAAEWVPSHPTPERISRLIELLTDPNRLCRFVAHDSLINLRESAVPALIESLSIEQGPRVVDALKVAKHMSDARLLSPAIKLSSDPYYPVRIAAVELLGALGGEQAVARLVSLVEDPESLVRAAAAETLGRLGHWNSAPKLVSLLGDEAWETRKASGLALVSLGNPGVVALRHSAKSNNKKASEMARRLLASSDAGSLSESGN
jgi:hypothetical protein